MRDKLSKIEGFKIFVDQLRHGHVEKIHEKFDPDFLDIHEKELAFEDPVLVDGEAYTAEDDLILHLEISTIAKIPCAICNETVGVPIRLQNFYHNEPLSDIKGGIFSMLNVIREGILIDTPTFAECDNGCCPKRKELEKYFKKSLSQEEDDVGHQPFKDLDSYKN